MAQPDYGSDLSCTTTLDPALRDISGVRVVIESLVRRFSTPTGWLARHPLDGLDLREFVGMKLGGRVDAAVLQSRIAAQALRDERVQSVQVAVVFAADSQSLRVTLLGQSAEGPFRFVLAVSKVTVELLSDQ